MMMYLRELFKRARFNMIHLFWKPADHGARPVFLQNLMNRYWSPTALISMTGQNNARGLTDENLAYDLPFLLAENSGTNELDLSHNQLGPRTIANLTANLFRTKITRLNLSNNDFDEAARDDLANLIGLIGNLKHLNLSNCHLSERNIATLIAALNKTTYIITLDVSNNEATPAQIAEINELLRRNTVFNILNNEHRKKDVLDLQRYPLNADALKDLAFYISKRSSFFFFESGGLKEIKAPILTEGLRDADFEVLIEALKKNNRITALTMDFRQLSAETEQRIRTQLMLNKARQKLDPGIKIENYARLVFIAVCMISTIPTAALLTLGAVIGRFAYNSYFFRQLQQAKSSDFSQPENVRVIERGKHTAHSWLSYMNPRAYTPMAYLGYAIEKENLSTKYDVRAECFKPKLRVN